MGLSESSSVYVLSSLLIFRLYFLAEGSAELRDDMGLSESSSVCGLSFLLILGFAFSFTTVRV
jgi:hypothetical protein